MPSHAWDTDVWVADTRKIQRELGWRASRSIAEGCTSTIGWLRGDEQLRRLYELRLRDPASG